MVRKASGFTKLSRWRGMVRSALGRRCRRALVIMPIEIERKFLVYPTLLEFGQFVPQAIEQGYLQDDNGFTTRVRVINDERAFLTLKGPRFGKHGCPEFEYSIPLDDARELLVRCDSRIILKDRYEIPEDQHVWHVDVFKGSLRGLHTAEVELHHDDEVFSRPVWLGTEVTAYRQFKNKSLAIKQSIPPQTLHLLTERSRGVGEVAGRKDVKKAARKTHQLR
jgi:adenylate cyclase